MSRAKIYLIILLFFPSFAHAFVFDEQACKNYGLGSNWRCEQKQKEQEEQNLSASDILNSPLAPHEKAEALNELWETQRKRAVITENKKEIEQFLETHNLILDKGLNFAKNVQNVIDNSPKYSSSNSYYKNRVEQELQEQEKTEILANAYKRYGLVFIYSSFCHHCGRQFPIILELKKTYKIKVLGISVDEHYFQGLDENIVDENIIHDPMIQSLPTMVLVDKQNPKKIFLAKGITSFADLESKIYHKIKEIQDYEENRHEEE